MDTASRTDIYEAAINILAEEPLCEFLDDDNYMRYEFGFVDGVIHLARKLTKHEQKDEV